MKINSVEDIKKLEEAVKAKSSKTIKNLNRLIEIKDPVKLLFEIKFGKNSAFDDNFIEETNLAFQEIVLIIASKYLLQKNADYAPFEIDLKNNTINSSNGKLSSEVIANISASNNKKLGETIHKLVSETAPEKKYIFYFSYLENESTHGKMGFEPSGIEIIHLSKEEVLAYIK